jgi:serine phosphatase RsbU (regulator of sigma subunit)/putative methionine-R-sulfoxide reductase with GAF domain
MTKAQVSPSAVWAQIHRLGEGLLRESRLEEQRDLIVQMTADLLEVKAELWLDERLFRLPGLNQVSTFLPDPPKGLMQRAFHDAEGCCQAEKDLAYAIPLRSQGLTIGVLLARRKSGSGFRKSELERLETLAGHAALALVASHRFAVEQWRLEQLNLVRRVSAQIANVLDLNSLTRRVTRLILDTFQYYYVAIFTLKPGRKTLEFWSSAGPGGKKTQRRSARAITVELGQGLIGEAAQTGEEIVTNDVAADPRYRRLEPLPGTRSEAVLPLKIGTRVLGTLDIQSDRLDSFHPNDLIVLRALADSIAIAVNRARLFSDLEERATQLSIITEVSKDITSVLELDELLTRVAGLIQEKLDFPYVHLYTVHLNRRQIIYEAGSGARSDALKGFTIGLDNSEGMIPWVARNGQTILTNDVSEEPRYKASPFPPENTRSELTIPLLYNNKPIGVLDLQSDRLNAFSEDDRIILEALADTIAAAIHNADLFQTERWRRQVADSLREVAGLLSADAGVDDVLDSVLRELERNLPCDVSAAWLLEGEELYLAHIHGAEHVEAEAAMHRWPEVNQYIFEALGATQPVIRKPTDPFDPTGLVRGYSADYSSIAASLRVGDRPLGVLILSHHTTGRYGHEAQAITSTFASYAAVAIENARLFDSAQEQAYASAALLQVAQTVVNTTSLEETIGSIVRITPILVGVKACAIYLWEKERFYPSQGYGFPDEVHAVLCKNSFGAGEFPLLDATREKAEMVIGVLARGLPEDWLEPELARNEQESYYAIQTSDQLLIGFPLAIRNDFYGVMLIEEDAESRRFRQKRIEIINGIVQQVAMSIQNDHLQKEMVARERFEHEIQLARQIQTTFLPEKLPELPQWDMAAVWRTARQVGGDFYDVFELPDRRLGLLIADVSDKGIPAALFMALTRTLIRAAVLDADSPAHVLKRVNDLIIPDNREEMFVTAVYGVLDIDTGRLTYANAGHNPPIWMNGKDREFVHLVRTCAALGVIEDMPVEERSINLHAGDTVLFYTDGLTEAFSPEGEAFGVENLESTLAACWDEPAARTLALLEKDVDRFLGSLQATDDLTMLALRRKNQA